MIKLIFTMQIMVIQKIVENLLKKFLWMILFKHVKKVVKKAYSKFLLLKIYEIEIPHKAILQKKFLTC